jgi:hypothetical protein
MNKDFSTLFSASPLSHAAENMNCHNKKQENIKCGRSDEIQKQHKGKKK